jgi:hypothetical protein
MSGYRPPSFNTWSGKHAMNLKVLRSTLSPSVLDYTLSIPGVCVYERQDGIWQKLQVTGPLFLAAVQDSPDPVIFVLTIVNAENPRNYTLTIPRNSAEQFVDDAQVHIKIASKQVMFSADSAADAQKLICEIANFVPPTTATPVTQKAAGSPQYINKDPTYQHLLRMVSTF